MDPNDPSQQPPHINPSTTSPEELERYYTSKIQSEGLHPHQSSHIPHPHIQDPRYAPHGPYHGMSYPAPKPPSNDGEKDLLDGTKLKTRDAVALAIALSTAIAGGYVQINTIENKLNILADENNEQTLLIKEIEASNAVEIKELTSDTNSEIKDIMTSISSLEKQINYQDNTFDRRFEDLEERVASLIYKARRSKNNDVN